MMQAPGRWHNAIERVVERMMRLRESELARDAAQNKPDPAEIDRAFHALQTSPNFEDDLMVFEDAYPGVFARRTALALRDRVR